MCSLWPWADAASSCMSGQGASRLDCESMVACLVLCQCQQVCPGDPHSIWLQVIAAACSQPPSSVGVDLSFEERQKRCVVAQSSLLTLSPLLQQLCRQPHEIGVQAMQAYESLSQLA